MSTVEKVFSDNKLAGKPTLVGYFPAGYPNIEASIEACVQMCEDGIDILELGVPYSDPVMDGLVIQEATETALANGFKLKDTFTILSEITKRVSTPVLVMTYWNPVMQYGVGKFAAELKAAGGVGMITPDLIVDEASEWIDVSTRLDLDRVFLATPSSSQSRVDSLVNASEGFIYTVSTMGITGARADLDAKARGVVSKIRGTDSPKNTAVGIGISTREQILEVNEYADGAIVGSVFVRAFADGGLSRLRTVTRDLTDKEE